MRLDNQGNLHDAQGRFASKNPVGDDGDLVEGIGESAERRCLDCAKRRILDLVWRASSVEVRGITFPDTKDIFHGVNPGSSPMDMRKVLVVNNLKHAWQYLFDHADEWLDWQHLSEYNRLCGQYLELNPGMMRNRPVGITGTTWQPDVLVRPEAFLRDFNTAMDENDPIRRATHLFAVACRSQWFFNGNKRTATMGANHSLIHDGVGVFALPPERIDTDFSDELLHYYESGDLPRIMDWLEYHAVGRIEDDGRTPAQLDGLDS